MSISSPSVRRVFAVSGVILLLCSSIDFGVEGHRSGSSSRRSHHKSSHSKSSKSSSSDNMAVKIPLEILPTHNPAAILGRSLVGKKVFITGASTGFGFETGKLFQSRGAIVVGSSRVPSNFPGHPFPLIAMDYYSKSSIDNAVDLVASEYGQIDILIDNGAELFIGVESTVSDDDLEANFDVIFQGHRRLMQRVITQSNATQELDIMITSSITAFYQLPNLGAYTTGKYALRHFSTFADSYALAYPRLSVKTLYPGSFSTEMVPSAVVRDGAGQGIKDFFYNFFQANNGDPADVALAFLEAYCRSDGETDFFVPANEIDEEFENLIYNAFVTMKPKEYSVFLNQLFGLA